MDLNELFNVFDRTAANLVKLEKVWDRAVMFFPSDQNSNAWVEYDDLRRAWDDLLSGLPPIDGWSVRASLSDLDELEAEYARCSHFGDPVDHLFEKFNQPKRDLAKYRYHFNRARRRAAYDRLQQLAEFVDSSLPRIIKNVPRESEERVTGSDADQVATAIAEIERLIGDAALQRGRWGDLSRHLRFGQGCDWHDIAEFDWPGVRPDVVAGALTDLDPLPVPDIDLAVAAASDLTGVATVALPWDRLDDDGFERLLYDLLLSIPEYENVQWLTKTRAPDRGRDLSMDRVIRDSTGSVRWERVIVQAKHWRSKSVDGPAVGNTVHQLQHWQPPVVHGLIIATSGRFSSDGVDWLEKHNIKGTLPLIEPWPENRIEQLLAQKPHLAAAHGLR